VPPRSTRAPAPEAQPAPAYQPEFRSNNTSSATGGAFDVFATIERLANLRSKSVQSDDEFLAKKPELLSRV
jgi:hypothetical protein